ncbi:MAG: hydroxyacid dehydrogenase, partial [Chloroflexi bacterium]|nr:hydroxyacid dehydrogenase [Chloroflexota bacterium]
MEHNRIKKDELLNTLPPEWPVDLLPEIWAQIEAGKRKVVVLDDDPTGTQTVHGIPVLTKWSVESLRAELANDLPAFYLLTNSRALPLAGARELNTEIGRNLVKAAQQAGRNFAAVSRSDSTLRGHFPGEVESLAEALGQTFDGWIVLPYFLEGGRFTVNDIHYVAEGEWLTPAGQTEFARDKAFGFQSSNLRDWVAEKMGGRVSAQDVTSISIDDIRRGGPERVTKKLISLPKGSASLPKGSASLPKGSASLPKESICVVNAVTYRDLEVFIHGLLAA